MTNIMLIGFMGCGKSTIASCLNREYGMDILEMDETIEQNEGCSISEIFERYGEEYFRDLETNLVMQLYKKDNQVVSCGGGVVLRECNIKAMKEAGIIVLLTASPETILERVKEDNHRPLLQGNKTVSFIKDMMEKRYATYMAAADIIVSTDGRTASEISREIIEKVQGE